MVKLCIIPEAEYEKRVIYTWFFEW